MSHHKSSSASPNEFILPDLGEGVAEAELIKWRVKPGDSVNEHDILAEMETDKALVEVPSPRAGVIAATNGKEGEIIKVGSVLVTFAGGTAGSSAPAHASPPATATKSGASPERSGASNGTRPPAASHGGGSEGREDAGTVVGSVGGSLAGVTAQPGKALATPAVRRLARDLGVDIDSVSGSGIGGRVLEADVKAAAGGGGTAPARGPSQTRGTPSPSTPPPPDDFGRQIAEHAPARDTRLSAARAAEMSARATEDFVTRSSAPAPARRATSSGGGGEATVRVPFRGVRRTIANRLRESIDQAVHFTVMDEADVTGLEVLRKKLSAASGEKLSFLPFVAAAVCRVLIREQFRPLNATVDEKPGDAAYESAVVQHRAVHLGIATDTDSGLMVPVIRDCDALGVLEIGRHIVHAAESARNRTASRENLQGSTFTISNVGSHAGRFATPVINYPECAILAVGRARPGPVVRNAGGMQGIFVGNLLPLSLACDHRVVDGAAGALALAEIIKLLQEPESLLGPARG